MITRTNKYYHVMIYREMYIYIYYWQTYTPVYFTAQYFSYSTLLHTVYFVRGIIQSSKPYNYHLQLSKLHYNWVALVHCSSCKFISSWAPSPSCATCTPSYNTTVPSWITS